jgi:YfiH family protein
MSSATILTSPLLERLPWIEHGFGTRHAPLSQDGMASLKQIHSAVVLAAEGTGSAGEGDALVTNQKNLSLSVRTADCFPILLADVRRRVVAAAHAGWRGTAAEISVKTLNKMTAEFGTEPGDIYAAIGPGIGQCCYEVGDEVARHFSTQTGLKGPVRLDLADINRRQLIEARVPESQIEIVGGCTQCDPARFYSYRRERLEPGRMISYIRVLA